MALDIHCLEQTFYFEFYLNDSFFHRVCYHRQETDISLLDLCGYLTADLYKIYRYKKFTGLRTGGCSTLRFHYLLQTTPVVADVDQPEKISNLFPLDLTLPPQQFCNHLLINLILSRNIGFTKSGLIQTYVLRGRELRAYSRNLFWACYPDKIQLLNDSLDKEIAVMEEAIARTPLQQSYKEAVMQNAISYTHNLYDNLKRFLDIHDRILYEGGKRESQQRLMEVLNNGQAQRPSLEALIDGNSYLHYLLGSFELVKPNDLRICNAVAYATLAGFGRKAAQEANDVRTFTRQRIAEMQAIKNKAIDRLDEILHNF